LERLIVKVAKNSEKKNLEFGIHHCVDRDTEISLFCCLFIML